MKTIFKSSFRSILVLVLLISVVTNVFATSPVNPSNYGNLNTSFTTSGYSSQIDVSALTLKYELSSITSMSKDQAYTVGFNVSNADGLKGMSLRVVIYNDPSGTIDPTTITGTSVDGDAFMFVWDQNDIAYPDPNPTPIVVYEDGATEENTGWRLYPGSSNTADFNNDTYPISYDFSFAFTISSIAIASDDWKINVAVSNGASTSQDSISFGSALAVQWYGAVEVREPLNVENLPSLSWGQVDYDAVYSDFASAADATVRYISNGNFDSYVSGSGSWSYYSNDGGGVDGTVYLSSNPTENGTFGIRINKTAYNFGDNSGGYVSGFTQLTSEWQSLDSSQSRTGESGIDFTYNMYLQLAGGFGNGTYVGNIKFGISNLAVQQ